MNLNSNHSAPRHHLLAAIFTGAMVFLIGVYITARVEERTGSLEKEQLAASATSVAAAFEYDYIQSLTGTPRDEDTKDFNHIRNLLVRIKATSQRYEYVYLMGKKGDEIIFMVDAEPLGSEDYSRPGDIYASATTELHQIFEDGVTFVEGPMTDEWGSLISALAAITDEQGQVIAILGLDEKSDLYTNLIASVRHVGWAMSALASIFSVLLITLFRQKTKTALILKEQAENIQTFLDATPDALVVVDDAGHIIRSNDEIYTVFGYPPDEVRQKPLKNLLVTEDYDRLVDIWSQYIETGKIEMNFNALEFNGIRQNGEVFPLALRISRFVFDGKVFSCGVFRDISERKAYETRLAAIREEADAANRAKSQYISGMSHELRTPLNSIIGFTELMQGAADQLSDEKKAEYLQNVNQSGRHMLDLIGQVLDIAKIESGTVDVDVEEIDLEPISKDCVNLIHPLAEAASLTLTMNLPSGILPNVMANAIHIKQIILNLLSNAVKYNAPGGSVTLALAKGQNDHIVLSVIDTGKGIPEDKVDELFASFNRLDQEGSGVEGHGVGLNIAKSLIEGMHGQIGFENNEGKGTTFWIEIPAARAEQRAGAHNVNAPSSVVA